MVAVGRVRHRWWIVVGTAVALLGLTVGAGWAFYLDQQIGDVRRVEVDLGDDTAASDDTSGGGGPRAAEAPEESAGPERSSAAREAVTILVAGVDVGDGRRIARAMAAGEWPRGVYRTDTIMLVHLTANRRRAHVVSIPRDVWVPVDGYGRQKINAAFSLGGPALYADTVRQLTGADLDHLMIVDWKAFRKVTTAVGGVKVRIPRDVYDPSQDVRWDAGTYRLQGTKALQYVRQRHGLPGGDLGRMRRQQNFLRSLLEKLMADGTLQNPVRLSRVVEAVSDNLVVDDGLSDADLRDLALSARGLAAERVTFVTAPTKGLARRDGQSVLLPKVRQTRRLFAAMQSGRMKRFLERNDIGQLPARVR